MRLQAVITTSSPQKFNDCTRPYMTRLKKCPIFLLVLHCDIDIAPRVQPRNSNHGQQQQSMICKFVRRMAHEQVIAVRNNTNQLTTDALGLLSLIEIGQIIIFCHLNPCLKELLHLAKTHQTSYSYKYCWVKESAIFLCKTYGSRAIKLQMKEDLDDLMMKESTNSTAQNEEPR